MLKKYSEEICDKPKIITKKFKIIMVVIIFIVLGLITIVFINPLRNKQGSNYNDISRIVPPRIDGYEISSRLPRNKDFVLLTYSANEDLKPQILSASVGVIVRKNPSDPVDYISFNEAFPLKNQTIEIAGAMGRMGYKDYTQLNGVELSKKYESIQIEVSKKNLLFSVQLGNPLNASPDIVLYKQEAVRVLEKLIVTYIFYE